MRLTDFIRKHLDSELVDDAIDAIGRLQNARSSDDPERDFLLLLQILGTIPDSETKLKAFAADLADISPYADV